MKTFWIVNWWRAMGRRGPGAEHVLTALAIPFGWAIGAIVAGAPFKTVWFGTFCSLVLSGVIQGRRYRRQARHQGGGEC